MRTIISLAILGALCGFVWAYVEKHPDVLEFVVGKGKEIVQRFPDKVDVPPSNRENVVLPPAPPVAEKTPQIPPIPPVKPAVPKADPSDSKLAEIENFIREGELEDAEKAIQEALSSRNIGDAASAALKKDRQRLDTYKGLIQESSTGNLVELPQVTKVTLKSGETCYVRILNDNNPDTILCSDVGGARIRLKRANVAETSVIDPDQSRDLYEREYRRKLQDLQGKKLSSKDYYDLADYCIRNGVNWHMTELFDKALALDKDLLNTVRVFKAKRLYDIFLFYLQKRKKDDADAVLKVLTKKYSGLVEIGKEEMEMLAALGNKPAIDQPHTDPTMLQPVNTDPANPQQNPPIAVNPPDPPSNPVSPDDARHQDLMAKANTLYDEAMTHLMASDPTENPKHADDENKKALDVLTKALNLYISAQEIKDSNWLRDRIRETNSTRAMCRKRAVSAGYQPK